MFFQMGEVYEKENKFDELRPPPGELPQEVGHARAGREARSSPTSRWASTTWKKSCAQKASKTAPASRSSASAPPAGRRSFYDINKKHQGQGKKIKEKKRDPVRPAHQLEDHRFDRNKSFAAKAQKHFADRAQAARTTGRRLRRSPAGRRARAPAWRSTRPPASAFHHGEKAYEAFLRIKFPEGLDFQQPSKLRHKKKAEAKKKKAEESQEASPPTSTRRSQAQLAGQAPTGEGSTTRSSTQESRTGRSPPAARIGQVWADFVDQLYTAPIPKELKVQDEWGNRPQEIFCDALVDKAEPIELKAVQGFEICLKAATE